MAYRVRVRRVMDPGRVLRGDGLQPPAAAVVGEGRAGAEADGLFAVPDGLDVQRRWGPGFELAVDGVQRVAGRRPCREPPDLAGAPARHLQELPSGKQTASTSVRGERVQQEEETFRGKQTADSKQTFRGMKMYKKVRGALCSRRRAGLTGCGGGGESPPPSLPGCCASPGCCARRSIAARADSRACWVSCPPSDLPGCCASPCRYIV